MSIRKSLPLFLLILSILSFSCKERVVAPFGPSWELEDAFAIASQDPNLKCLIVYKDEHIVKEQYFHPGDSTSAHDVRSVTKSVMATLIGIAIDKGLIPSENQTIGSYLTPVVGAMDSAKEGITIRDVLSMSSGLSGNDLPDVTEYNNWYNAPNQLQYTLNKSLVNQPGQVFGYNTGAAHLTSVILTQASEMSTLQFAKQYLFRPLDIADPPWRTDKQGYYNGGAALSITPHDMLKIGLLYLNRGVYNGVRIVSESWIDKASNFQITTNGIEPFGPGYGYLWWTGTSGPHSYCFANGYGGQFIVIVPDLRLIVVATNQWSGVASDVASEQWYSTLSVIMNRIIPLYE